MTESEYLTFAETSEIKHEFSRGRVYAMTGGSVRHGIITLNIGTQLNVQLVDRDCTVTSPDVRVHVAARDVYRYPDVTVFCGDPVYAADRADTLTNPVVLIEVLSPGTALTDHSDKLHEYTQIATLQAYLLVAQSEPRIETYTRQDASGWLYEMVNDPKAAIAIPSIGCTLALSDIYRKVTFDTALDSDTI